VLVHALDHFIYYKMKQKHLNLPRDLYQLVQRKNLVKIKSDEDIAEAFLTLRRMAKFFRIRNKCLHVSLVLYRLTQEAAQLQFSALLEDDGAKAHVWVTIGGKMYSTDMTYKNEQSIYTYGPHEGEHTCT
jgi:Transglutaminase-like superfamily